VTDVASAAILVETWARPDLSDPVLADLGPGGQTVVVAAPGSRVTFALAAAAESARGDDGSVWAGVSLSLAARLGLAVAGLTLRFRTDTELGGDGAQFDADRAGIELLADVDFPIHAGPVVLAPGCAVGAGWMQARSPDPDMDHIIVEDNHVGLRAEVNLDAYLPVATGVELYAGLGLELVPLAHGTTYAPPMFVIGEPHSFVRLGAGVAFVGW
jgi:hypothetical protein